MFSTFTLFYLSNPRGHPNMASRKSGELGEEQAKLTDFNLVIEKYNQG